MMEEINFLIYLHQLVPFFPSNLVPIYLRKNWLSDVMDQLNFPVKISQWRIEPILLGIDKWLKDDKMARRRTVGDRIYSLRLKEDFLCIFALLPHCHRSNHLISVVTKIYFLQILKIFFYRKKNKLRIENNKLKKLIMSLYFTLKRKIPFPWLCPTGLQIQILSSFSQRLQSAANLVYSEGKLYPKGLQFIMFNNN